jgi:sugar lactone lactonase YvrE
MQDRRYTMKVLVRGAPLHESNGIWADGRGHLYVGTVGGVEIAVLDARTGHVLDRLTRDEGYGCADDVTMGPDGSLYWTDIFEGQVGRRAPDGTISRLAVAPAMNPITFSADGRLFVAQSFMPFGDALFEIDPAFRAGHPPRLVWDPGDGYPFLQQLNGFDFGPDGLLYAPQPYLGTVVRLDVDAAVVTPQVVAQGLSMPTAVKFDSQGRLFAATATGIVRVDVASGVASLYADIPTGLDNLAFDPADRLYCTGGGDGAVYRILPSGVPRTLSRPGIGTPGGIAVMPGSHRCDAAALYVADVFSLARFDARTGRGEGSEWSGAMTMPFTVAPDGADLVLASWMGNCVQVWDPASRAQVAAWYDLPVPLNAITFQGDLVITTLGTGGQVVRQDAGGGRDVIATGLYVPSGLAATDDDLWVADWASGIVWQLVSDGVTLPTPRFVTAGLAGPEGLAVDRDGTLLVVEVAARRLTRVDPASGAQSPVASDLRVGIPATPSGVPYWALSGVAVDAAGSIYVTGDEGSRVYRLNRVHTDW